MAQKKATTKKVMARKGAPQKSAAARKAKAKGIPKSRSKKSPRSGAPFVSTGYWLMKSEPESYSIDALKRDGRALWTGVRNYQARNFMMTAMQPGDRMLFYHSNADPSAAVGTGRIERVNLPDTSALDRDSDYYDPKSSADHPIWFCCEISFGAQFKRAVSLDEMRRTPGLSDMQLLRPGQRLSILPLAKSEFEQLVTMGDRPQPAAPAAGKESRKP